jgi:hypothetical protein
MKQRIFRSNVAMKAHKLVLRIVDTLRRVVSPNQEGARRIRHTPRISSATGGLQLGIDLTDSAVYEHDDLEGIRRIEWRAPDRIRTCDLCLRRTLH